MSPADGTPTTSCVESPRRIDAVIDDVLQSGPTLFLGDTFSPTVSVVRLPKMEWENPSIEPWGVHALCTPPSGTA
jgi:hypothetical protein